MKNYLKNIIIILIIPVFIFASFIGLYWWRTEISIDKSPTDEYYIKKYWTDVGAWGWVGKIYLVKKRVIDKKYWTGWNVPATSEWVSDYEFELIGPQKRRTFHVNDFIKD